MKYYEVDFRVRFGSGNDTYCDGQEEYMLLQSVRDVIAEYAGEAGFETFEDTDDGIRGYIQTQIFDREATEELMGSLPFDNMKVTLDVREAEDKDWNEAWENEGFEPIAIGRRCLIHDGRHLPDHRVYDMEVEIDAKMAFGTGTHETTRMVAGALLDMNLDGKSVLDCGCGTGILGIVALKHGAADVTGYDIDEWSADNTRHNAVINHVDRHYRVLLGDSSVIAGMTAEFDVVAANINRNILLADMPRFRNAMRKGATLILSGFYTDDTGLLKEKAEALGLRLTATHEDNHWAAMVLKA